MTELVHENTLVFLPPVCTRMVDAGGQDRVHYTDTPEASVDDIPVDERLRLAASAATATDTLLALADDPSRRVRLALTFNPSIPMVALVHLLKDRDSRVRSCAERAFSLRGGDPTLVAAEAAGDR